MKRKLANARLGRPQNNQILTAKNTFLYCCENITGITFFYAHAHEVQTVRNDFKRFEKESTVPGTRSFHWFSSQSVGSISYKRVLNDSSLSGTHSFFEASVKFSANDIKVMSYIACVYDERWWVGLKEEVDKDNNDIYDNFMHPFRPTKTFFWPAREDKCHVALSSICMILSIPTTTTGRSYSFAPKYLEDVQKHYMELQ